MKILSTFRPAFLPDLVYFWQMSQSQLIVFTDHLQFSKGSSINRSAPLNTDQDILSIPVKHDQQKVTIAQKRMASENFWRQKHLKTLHHLFHNFPFAEYYLPQIEEIYKAEINSLADLLFLLTDKIKNWLHLPVKIVRSGELNHDRDATALILQWCRQFECQGYMAFAETFHKGWVQKDLLNQQNIKVFQFPALPSSHFLANYANKSIIHFLLQFGPEAGYILKQYSSARLQEVD